MDDQILSAWNGLMIAALCALYRASRDEAYLSAAKKANRFLLEKLYDGDVLFASFSGGRRGVPGFLDDYAAFCFAQLSLYAATLETEYLEMAKKLCEKAYAEFADEENGGFFFYGQNSERLILRPKETYDGAIPSGNSLMAWNLVQLWLITEQEEIHGRAERQLRFLEAEASHYPVGYAMFLNALLHYRHPPVRVTVVLAQPLLPKALPLSLPADCTAVLLKNPTDAFPLKDGKTTFYVCRDHKCFPPVNDLKEVL